MLGKPTPPIPAVLTAKEACDLLAKRTGEHWTLAQLLHVCPRPSVWIDYDPDAPAEVFGDRWEGFCAPMIFANDVHRLLHADDVALTMTRTPDDRLIRIAGMRFPMDSLRFDREDVLAAVRDCGASTASPEGPTSQEGQEHRSQGTGDGSGGSHELPSFVIPAQLVSVPAGLTSLPPDARVRFVEAYAGRRSEGVTTAGCLAEILTAKASRQSEGWLVIDEAAQLLQDDGRGDCEDWRGRLTAAALKGDLAIYEAHSLLPVVNAMDAAPRDRVPVRTFHDWVHVDDLNRWLGNHAPRLPFRFSSGADDREIAIALTNARVRHDDIQIEIDEAAATLRQRRGSVTAATVMALLRERAGQPNSCISEIAGDGVIWIRGSNGSPEKLTMGALKGRITRDRKRTQKNR